MKTITNIAIINGKVLITYINDVNIQLTHEVDTKDLINYNAFESELQSVINAIPDIVESPVFIKYQEDIFTITGNKKEPVLLKYEYLTEEEQGIVDAMKFKVYQVLGEQFVSLQAKINSNKVTVNNIEYDYNLFKGKEFEAALQLAFELLNR